MNRKRCAAALATMAAVSSLALVSAPTAGAAALAPAATAAKKACHETNHLRKGGYADAWCTGYRTGYVRAVAYCAKNTTGTSGGSYYFGRWVGRDGQHSWAVCPSNKYLIDGGYDLDS